MNPQDLTQPMIDPDTKEPLFQEIEETKLLYSGPKLEVFSRKDYVQPLNALMDKIPDWEMRKVRIEYGLIRAEGQPDNAPRLGVNFNAFLLCKTCHRSMKCFYCRRFSVELRSENNMGREDEQMKAGKLSLFIVAAVILALVFSLGGVVAAAPGEEPS